MLNRLCNVAAAASVVLVLLGRAAASPAPDASLFMRAYARPAPAGTTAIESDKVWALGQRLFFDPRLSAASNLACASCHRPDQSWSDRLPRAIGSANKPLAFRAPTLLNAGQIERYGWTGRFADLEAVTFFAMNSPANMNLPTATLLERLGTDPTYIAAFRAAFPNSGTDKQTIDKHRIGLALSRYVRSIVSDNAPFDRWIAGDAKAISASAIRGFTIFNGKGGCASCHEGWAFTDVSYHDVGTATDDDIGRGKFFKTSVKLQYAFKTPTLRNVAARAPYMHDGSFPSLAAVIDHYNKGGIDRPSRAENIKPLGLSAGEERDLIAFLETLTSGTRFVAPDGD
jgi:cytochrome c peroxidase